MIRAPEEFIKELKSLFLRFDVYLSVGTEYDDEGNSYGKTVEIKSNNFIDGSLPILIDDFHELANLINT